MERRARGGREKGRRRERKREKANETDYHAGSIFFDVCEGEGGGGRVFAGWIWI